MPITMLDLGLAYFPVPKCACTSLKHVFYEMKTGRPFAPYPGEDGRLLYVHDVPGYASEPFSPAAIRQTAGLRRIAVIRDPVSRFVSCYKNRVLHNMDLITDAAAAQDEAARALPVLPSFEEFAERIAEYRAGFVSIRHHTDPQVAFLGRDPSLYADVFGLRDLPRLAELLSTLAGRSIAIGHEQTGGSEFADPEVTPRLRRLIEALYADDLRIWAPLAG